MLSPLITFLILYTRTTDAETLVIALAKISDQSFIYIPYIVQRMTPITKMLYIISEMSFVFLLFIILKA